MHRARCEQHSPMPLCFQCLPVHVTKEAKDAKDRAAAASADRDRGRLLLAETASLLEAVTSMLKEEAITFHCKGKVGDKLEQAKKHLAELRARA